MKFSSIRLQHPINLHLRSYLSLYFILNVMVCLSSLQSPNVVSVHHRKEWEKKRGEKTEKKTERETKTGGSTSGYIRVSYICCAYTHHTLWHSAWNILSKKLANKVSILVKGRAQFPDFLANFEAKKSRLIRLQTLPFCQKKVFLIHPMNGRFWGDLSPASSTR